MDKPNEKFFTLTDNLFTFSNFVCDCVTDVENIKPGEIKETVKMQALPNKPVRFAFAPSYGMVRLADTGAINSNRILSDLLNIQKGKKDMLFSFFTEYGFFFPLSASGYEAVDIDALYSIVERIKALVALMGSIGEAKKNYKKILSLVLYLNLTPPTEVHFSCFGGEIFKTCEHTLYTEMAKAALLPQFAASTIFDDDSYTIDDTIFSPSYRFNIDEFNNIIGGYAKTVAGNGSAQMFKDITRLYCNAPNLSYELRQYVDLLFHFQHSIAVVKNYDSDGNIEYYDTDENVRLRYSSNFNDPMKRALINVAKVTVRDEIECNLGGMRPQYDIETMSPSWEIQDLLTGIYVSLFFMRPGIELYRKCSNPSCNRMFLVNTTSAKRKYCSASCRNAATQRAHRLRKQGL